MSAKIQALNAVHFWEWVKIQADYMMWLVSEHPERQFEIAEHWQRIKAEISERNP